MDSDQITDRGGVQRKPVGGPLRTQFRSSTPSTRRYVWNAFNHGTTKFRIHSLIFDHGCPFQVCEASELILGVPKVINCHTAPLRRLPAGPRRKVQGQNPNRNGKYKKKRKKGLKILRARVGLTVEETGAFVYQFRIPPLTSTYLPRLTLMCWSLFYF